MPGSAEGGVLGDRQAKGGSPLPLLAACLDSQPRGPLAYAPFSACPEPRVCAGPRDCYACRLVVKLLKKHLANPKTQVRPSSLLSPGAAFQA